MRRKPSFPALLVCALTVGAGCSTEPAAGPSREKSGLEGAAAGAPASGLADLLPYGREPWPGIITAGQPSRGDFETLRRAGLRTVINLRVPSERGTRDEPEWMDEIGLDYVSIPVHGADGLTEEVARELDEALATVERPVLVHCGSSNRVGAVFALRAFYVEGVEPDAALEVGLASGVTRLEGAVREILERERTGN